MRASLERAGCDIVTEESDNERGSYVDEAVVRTVAEEGGEELKATGGSAKALAYFSLRMFIWVNAQF